MKNKSFDELNAHLLFIQEAIFHLQEIASGDTDCCMGEYEIDADDQPIIAAEILSLEHRYSAISEMSDEAYKKEDAALFKRARPKVFVRDNGRCRYCQKDLVYEDIFHIDHIYPKSKGGTSEMENLALACPECNRRKKARTPDEAGMFLL